MNTELELQPRTNTSGQPWFTNNAAQLPGPLAPAEILHYVADKLELRTVTSMTKYLADAVSTVFINMSEEHPAHNLQLARQMESTMVKIQSLMMREVYDHEVKKYPANFVLKVNWPEIMSFAANRVAAHYDIVVPIPFALDKKRQAEYSKTIIMFYTHLCKLQDCPVTLEHMHLHRYGWLRKTDTKQLVDAASKLSKGQFDTLRFKSLKALDHVLNLGINPLIEKLSTINSENFNVNRRAPLQKAFTQDVHDNVLSLMKAFETQVQQWVDKHLQGNYFAEWDGHFPSSCKFDPETLLQLHEQLLPYVFGCFMYAIPKMFQDGKHYDARVHASNCGLRRDHIKIGFDSCSLTQIFVSQGNVIVRVNKANKVKHMKTKDFTIDSTSTVGKALYLMLRLGLYVKAPAFFFMFKSPGFAPKAFSLYLYKKMATVYELPKGMAGITAARLTQASNDIVAMAEAVHNAGGLTEEVLQEQQQRAANCLHSMQEHHKYAVRAAKRKDAEDTNPGVVQEKRVHWSDETSDTESIESIDSGSD